MDGPKTDTGAPAKAKFILVKDPKLVLPILKERHPQSCYMHNQVIFCDGFKESLQFYSVSDKLDSNTWFVSRYIREDNGRDICISAPNAVIREKAAIPSEIRECFSSGDVIDWDDAALFVALERPVSVMISEISAYIKGNVTVIHPSYLYYMEIDTARNISIDSSPGVEISRLDQDRGTDFIMSTWKYARPKTRGVVFHSIGALASAGVFLDGECASGVIVFGDGFIHCLHTSKDYRNRGFGKLTMKYCMKEYAKDGCYPCSTVEVKNPPSVAFHESLFAKRGYIVDYIEMQKFVID